MLNGYTDQYINSGVGINKNYIFHNFKFHVSLWSSGETSSGEIYSTYLFLLLH